MVYIITSYQPSAPSGMQLLPRQLHERFSKTKLGRWDSDMAAPGCCGVVCGGGVTHTSSSGPAAALARINMLGEKRFDLSETPQSLAERHFGVPETLESLDEGYFILPRPLQSLLVLQPLKPTWED
jgi:hypothetical protein